MNADPLVGSPLIRPRRRWRVWVCAGLLAAAAITAVTVLDPYRRAPSPDGMVLRVPIGEVRHPALSRAPVALANSSRNAILVRRVGPEDDLTETFAIEYPTGQRCDAVLGLTASEASPPPPLDLDGDGTQDRILIGQGHEAGLVRVLSGADGETLFQHFDELEYFYGDTAFSLGDLDGDGFGELGMLHPRQDRNAYDFHPLDAILEPRSWITVVSGSRLFAE